MILPREKNIETQLTAVSSSTYSISSVKRQISAHSTATTWTLFWALLGAFLTRDITSVTLSLSLYISHHLISSTAIVMCYISLGSHFRALLIDTTTRV